MVKYYNKHKLMKTKFIPFILLVLVSISCKKSTKTATLPYPTDGLVSYFNFDDNLKDQRGYANDGVNTGGATFDVGKAGKAIVLNGTTQKIVFSPKAAKLSTSISVAVWVKTSENITKFFIDGGTFTFGNLNGYKIFFQTSQAIVDSFVAGQWTHVVGTYDGTNTKIYINGILKQTANPPGAITGFNANLVLGYFDSDFWAGSIDDLFIYNKALSQTEINTLYNLHK